MVYRELQELTSVKDIFIPCHSEMDVYQSYEGQLVYDTTIGSFLVFENGERAPKELEKGITLEDF